MDIPRRSHLQSLRDPFHRHRRLRPQPRRHHHLPRVPFGSSSQFLFPPTPSFQFFREDPFGMRFDRLLPLHPIMLRSFICPNNSFRNDSAPKHHPRRNFW